MYVLDWLYLSSLWQVLLVSALISAPVSLCTLAATRRRRTAIWFGAITPGIIVAGSMIYAEMQASVGPVSIALLPSLLFAVMAGILSAQATVYFAVEHEW
jgi:hypothetical protein